MGANQTLVVATENTFEPGCVANSPPLVPRNGIPPDELIPKGLLPFPARLIASACPYLEKNIFP
jgi:hypothetical protein